MEKYYEDIRRKVLIIYLYGLWTVAVVDYLYAIYILIAGRIKADGKVMLLMTTIALVANLAAYVFLRGENIRPDLISTRKNGLIATGLVFFAGTIAMVNGAYIETWIAPSVAAVFTALFRDKKLQRYIFAENFFFIILSAIIMVVRHPYQASNYLGHMMTMSAVSAVMLLISDLIRRHYDLLTEDSENSLEKQQEMENDLSHDLLTGVYSRKKLMENAVHHMGHARLNNPITVVMVDIDKFKSVNDTYGHDNGDEVLRRLGAILVSVIAPKVTVGRFGGEEFVLIYEGIGRNDAEARVEELRERFSSQQYDFTDRRITFSAGLITAYDKVDFDLVLKQADDALYNSKENGRDRITSGDYQSH